jgi:hypothetical protein
MISGKWTHHETEYLKYEVFTAMYIQVDVFCAVTPRGFVVRQQSIEGHCYIHLQDEDHKIQ